MELSRKMKNIVSAIQKTRKSKYAKFADGHVLCSDSELKKQTEVLKTRLKNGESLDDILIDAYAVVVETASRVLGKEFYDEQIAGGIVVNNAMVAEMNTGEGKTLMSVLPGYLNALSGEPVHIFTANEYLAERDALEMGKIYGFLGLSVGVIKNGQTFEEKKAAYAADITYGTSSEFGFDFLRDNMVRRLDAKVRRGFGYAIVDEADNILIDDAIIPLVVSGNSIHYRETFTDEDFAEMRIQAEKASEIVDKLGEGDFEFDGDYVGLTEQGQKKVEKAYNDSGYKMTSLYSDFITKYYIDNALQARFTMKEGRDYFIKDNAIMLINSNTGRAMQGMKYSYGIQQAIEAKERLKFKKLGRDVDLKISDEEEMRATISLQSFFRMYKKLSGMSGTAKRSEDEFENIYGLSVEQIPTHKKLIRNDEADVYAVSLEDKYKKICNDVLDCAILGQPVLVGTLSVKESEILYGIFEKSGILELFKMYGIKLQLLNAKNDKEEAEIIAQAGRPKTITIATNMAGRGTDILLGGNSELLAKKELRKRGYSELAISYAVLGLAEKGLVDEYLELKNAFDLQVEKEREQVVALGGLRVIGTGHNSSKRVDDQLRGRAGRQGDPGSSVFYASPDDELIRDYLKLTRQTLDKEKLINKGSVDIGRFARLIKNAQETIERVNYGSRKLNLEDDFITNKKREIYYQNRDEILSSDSIRDLLSNVIDGYVEDVFDGPNLRDLDRQNLSAFLDNLSASGKLLSEVQSQDILEKFAGKKLAKVAGELRKAIYDSIGSNFAQVLDNLEKKHVNVEIMKEIFTGMIDRHWIDFIIRSENERYSLSIETLGGGDRLNMFMIRTDKMFGETLSKWREEVLTKSIEWANGTDKRTNFLKAIDPKTKS